MSPANHTLPPGVQNCLDRLHQRVRLGRALRGLGLLAFVLAGIMLVGIGLDVYLDLETPHLRLCLALCGLVSLALLWLGVIRPWIRPASTATAAAVLEHRHPELYERLTTLVHLQRSPGTSQGSLHFQNALHHQTEEACRHLDPAIAIPLRRSTVISCLGTTALLATLVLGSIATDSFLERLLGSFSAPWHGYTLKVSPGKHAFPAGQAVWIEVEVVQHRPRARKPGECTLVLVKENGVESRIAMQPGKQGFRHELKDLASSVSYYVDADGLHSETYPLLAVSPVYLAENGFQAVSIAPPYADRRETPIPPQKAIEATQFGAVQLRFTTNRAPVASSLIWRNEAGEDVSFPLLKPLTWDEETGQGVWLLPEKGRWHGTLVLEAEHGVVFRNALPAVEVMEDLPPRLNVTAARLDRDLTKGTGESGAVPPGDNLRLEVQVEDAVGLGRLFWEIQINEAKPQPIPIRILSGQRTFEETLIVTIPSDTKANDRVRLRIIAEDNRVLKQGSLGVGIPARDLGPNASSQSFDFVVRDVDSLRKREVLAKRDQVDGLLKQFVKKLDALRSDVANLRTSTHAQPTLRPDQQKKLEKLTERNQDLRLEMMLLSESLRDEGGLDPLALQIEEIAQRELAESQAALEKTAKSDAGTREKELHRSEDQLLQGVRKLQGLHKLNAALAQDRLDRHELSILADKEERLAGKLDAKMDAAMLKQMELEQEKIRKGLDSLLQSSPLLGGLLKDLAKDQTEKAMKGLDEIAKLARNPGLDDTPLDREELDALSRLAKEQGELATRVDAWQKALELRPRIEQARMAAEAMQISRWGEALGQQRQAEEALKLRSDLIETGARDDLRGKVLHLAKTQEGINQELVRLGEELPRLKDNEQMQRIASIRKAQRDLEIELAALKVPESASPTLMQMRAAIEEIVTLQKRGDFLGAFFKMEEAPRQLEGLAGSLPDVPIVKAKDPADVAEVKKKSEAARKLGEEQTLLRQRLEKLLADAAARGEQKRLEHAAEMSRKASSVADDLLKLSQKMGDVPGKGKMEGASKLASEASKLMDAAGKMPDKMGAETIKEAALKLEAARKMGNEAMDGLKGKDSDEIKMRRDPEAARNVEMGRRDLDQAKMDLRKGDAASAGKSMLRAAEAMKRASVEPRAGKRAMAAGKTGGKTPATGGTGPGALARVPEKALERFAGKAWGELPGEVKAQLMLQMQQRFGEEYQAIIQRYFDNLSRDEESRR